jgi:hypothetical protein
MDPGCGPCKEAGSLDDLGGHDPYRGFVEKGGTGKEHDFPSPGGKIGVFLFPDGYVGKKTAQHGAMNAIIESVVSLSPIHNPLLPQNGCDLVVRMNPLPHPGIGEKVLFTELAHLVLGLQALPLAVIAIPYLEQGQEVGIRVLEGSMHLIGLKGFFYRSFPGVLDAQGCGNHGRLLKTALPARLDHHAGDSWVLRNPGHEPCPWW